MPGISIRIRLMVVLLLLAAAPLAVVGYTTYNRDRDSSRHSALVAIRASAEQQVSTTLNVARTYAGLATFLADLPATRQAVATQRLAQGSDPFDAQVGALIASSPLVSGAFLARPDASVLRAAVVAPGGSLESAPVLPPVAGTPPPLPALIATAAHGDQAIAVTHGPGTLSAQGDLWVAARVLGSASTGAVLLLRIDGHALLPPVADPAHGISTQVIANSVIFDGTGLSAAGATVSTHPGLAPILATSGTVTYGESGRGYTAVVLPIPGLGWQVLARQPTSEIASAVPSTLPALVQGGVASALALLVGIALAVTFLVTRPLNRIRTAVGEIAGGRLDSPLPIGARDELGELALAIERMRQGLQADALYAQRRANQLSAQLLNFTHALEPIAEGQLHRRVPLLDDPESPLLDAVEATNNLIRRFRRLVAGLKVAVREVLESSAQIRTRIGDAAYVAGQQQDGLEHQRALVSRMSRQAGAAGAAARATAAATEQVHAGVRAGGLALSAVSESSDGIRQRTLENTNRIKKLQDTAITLTGLVGQVQDMAGSLQLLAYNGTLHATQGGSLDPAFARMSEETQALAASFEATLTEIRLAVENAQRDISAVILSSEAVAQNVIGALQARDNLTQVFAVLATMVQVLSEEAASAQAQALEQAQLASSVREGNDLLAQAYERIRVNLEQAVLEIAQHAGDFDRLAGSVADLQIDPPAASMPQLPRPAA